MRNQSQPKTDAVREEHRIRTLQQQHAKHDGCRYFRELLAANFKHKKKRGQTKQSGSLRALGA